MLNKKVEYSKSFMFRAYPAYSMSANTDVNSQDIEDVWDEHLKCEFETHDVEGAMNTMIKEPYVHDVPVPTAGIGHDGVYNFYKNHFIGKTPTDTRVVRISRTVSKDQVVDELIFSFTHDIELEFMLPGVTPTGKYVEVPLVAIIKFDGDKIAHEHIYWDQASVLSQIGLIDTKGLPIMGIEQATKLLEISQKNMAQRF